MADEVRTGSSEQGGEGAGGGGRGERKGREGEAWDFVEEGEENSTPATPLSYCETVRCNASLIPVGACVTAPS